MTGQETTAGADGRRERLLALVTEHRPNVVTEQIGPDYLQQWRTRIKCDGHSCDFYAEGARYWTVVLEHDAHLTDAILASGFADEIRAAALAPIEALADEWDVVLAECKEVDSRWILDRSVTTLETAARTLRNVLRADRTALGGRDRGKA